MLKALIAVDGSGHALDAGRHVIKLVAQPEPLEVHLLNVHPPLPNGRKSLARENDTHG